MGVHVLWKPVKNRCGAATVRGSAARKHTGQMPGKSARPLGTRARILERGTERSLTGHWARFKPAAANFAVPWMLHTLLWAWSFFAARQRRAASLPFGLSTGEHRNNRKGGVTDETNPCGGFGCPIVPGDGGLRRATVRPILLRAVPGCRFGGASPGGSRDPGGHRWPGPPGGGALAHPAGGGGQPL